MKSLTKILFVALLLVSARKASADTEDRHLSGFHAVEVGGSFDVYITQGPVESVRVEAPAEEMERIKTEVVGGTLKIYNRDHNFEFHLFGNHPKRIIRVTIKDVTGIGVGGSGDVFLTNTINANSLYLHVSGSGDLKGDINTKELDGSVSGSGDMKISGRANRSTLSVSGSGDLHAADLITESTSIHVSGSGGASVHATERLEASVSGSGDISYTGSPKSVSTSKSGSGSIHRGM